ncbi:uncharacterized protein LOC34621977 [Cyclospora cayetanensis]|nr:uncharacterized protein LOC34621977 [Cyclospora cayetanensis]
MALYVLAVCSVGLFLVAEPTNQVSFSKARSGAFLSPDASNEYATIFLGQVEDADMQQEVEEDTDALVEEATAEERSVLAFLRDQHNAHRNDSRDDDDLGDNDWDDEEHEELIYVCFVSNEGAEWACANRAPQQQYPGGMYCPHDMCCSDTVSYMGKVGKICTSDESFCQSYNAEYSYGRCTCEHKAAECPQNSSCKNTKKGSGCECDHGYIKENGKCVKRGSTATSTTTAAAPHASGKAGPCTATDCRPGFCKVEDDAISCTCVSGYIPKEVNGRPACAYPYAN